MKLPQGERTPMLEQYMAIKRKHPEAILFFRMGDFFEMFYEDAKTASEVLGLRLTSRAHGKAAQVPLAGFPYHQLDNYLTRMVDAGRRVVIVEQVEDPKKAKGLVKRDVVRVVTAGTNPAALDRDDPGGARIAALIRGSGAGSGKDADSARWGFAWADLGTGEFLAGEFSSAELAMVVGMVAPVELLVPESRQDVGPPPVSGASRPIISTQVDWVWELSFARQTLLSHFKTASLKGFGLEDAPLAISAAGALLYYLQSNIRQDPSHLTGMARADFSDRMIMDVSTIRNLELFNSLSGDPRASLFSVIDRTVTAAGRRLLYQRLREPLRDRERIEERLDAVGELCTSEERRINLAELLKQTGDQQRLLARLATGRGRPSDLAALRDSLELIPRIDQALEGTHSRLIQALRGRIQPLPELKKTLMEALMDDPPPSTSEGGIIRDGYNKELDELRSIQTSGKSWLADYEAAERARTGIGNLKVGYNKVFGYFIEITKSNLSKAPGDYIRRQTLVNAERYTSPPLQEYETRLLDADSRIIELEIELYQNLLGLTLEHSAVLQDNALALAELDVLQSLGSLAAEENYCRPTIDNGLSLEFGESRHPVVEHLMPPGEQFVPNDLMLTDDLRILIITGPNMAGKSTYLRQVALCVILAQMGSFVPAKIARIGIVDRLFTRIGALDNLAGGESTFMVEMQETASILHNATPRSLVLFDEVGRGTSTFDGLSLAWAIVEYLSYPNASRGGTGYETPTYSPPTSVGGEDKATPPYSHSTDVGEEDNATHPYSHSVADGKVEAAGKAPRTLFATHFHEMTDLERYLPGVENRNVAVREYDNRVMFLRKIIPGASDRSFGIHVAQMAGLPQEVIVRAREVLANLEANDLNPVSGSPNDQPAGKSGKRMKSVEGKLPQRHIAQLTLFDPVERKLRGMLEGVDVNNLSPVDALNLLSKLKEELY